MKRTAVIDVVGLTRSLIGDDTPYIQSFAERTGVTVIEPPFPAVTCTAQSNFLTGETPDRHGIVGNGWYNRAYAEVHFWKQSDHLVSGPKIWDRLKALDASFTCAKMFWWFNMYSSVDFSATPRPMYPADGRKIFDIYTKPMEMREELKGDLGVFPFLNFWGPRAGIESSQWIAESAKWIEEKRKPTLNLVYLPHLDYNLQRLGPSHPDVGNDLREIDRVVGDLIRYFERRSVRVLLLSEYGIGDVNHPVFINRILRDRGWITIKDELGLEQLDCGASRAFAVADHQVAHVYINDPAIRNEVRSVLESIEGVGEVLDEEGKRVAGLAHHRAGDFVLVADPGSWFAYYYWRDDKVAPDYARCVDIHRKPGYDPAELFIDPNLPFPSLDVAKFLLKKNLGFRALLPVIPLDAGLVKGSHGLVAEAREEWPVFIGSANHSSLPSTQVAAAIERIIIEE